MNAVARSSAGGPRRRPGPATPATEGSARLQRVRSALHLALGTGIVAQSALLVRAVLASTAGVASPTPVAAPAAPPASAEALAAAVFAAHLFGEAPAAPTDAAPSAAIASVELRGTIALPDPGAGYAILAVNGAARVYRAGEPAGDGVTLTAVYADRVVVAQAGVAQTIVLPRSALTGNYVPVAVADADASVEAVIAPSQEQLNAEAELERIRAFNEAERAAAARLQARAR